MFIFDLLNFLKLSVHQIARGATKGKMTTISLWNYSEVLKDDIEGKS